MHHRVRNRLLISVGIILTVSVGLYITLYFLSENIVFFVAPSEVSAKHIGKKIRLGGLVQKGSIKRPNVSETVFDLTDGAASFRVQFRGILPSLFRESQGIVAEGYIEEETLIASRLLTKHDENYKPPKNYIK